MLMAIRDEWQLQAVKLHNTGMFSVREMAAKLSVPKSTVHDYLKKYAEFKTEDIVSDGYDNSRILFISDMHIPYHHPKLLPFLSGLKLKYNPTRVIILGDEMDKHAMSFHDSDPDLHSAGDELRAALPVIAEVHKMFPIADVIDSNHGSMVLRKAKHHGIPRHYIKSYNDVLGVGAGWVWHNELTITLPDGRKVYVHHGKSAEAIKTSQAMSMSHVCGHFHESFGVKYWANPTGLYFAVNLKRPIIGTSLLIDGVPVLEAMDL